MVPPGLVDAIAAHLIALGLTAEAAGALTLERPRKPEHGDWAVNVFPFAKAAGRPGPELAAAVADLVNADRPAHVAKAEAVGGFLNLKLDPGWLGEVLRTVVAEGVEGFARTQAEPAMHVNVEFVSANPTGPLHAGHGRWAAYGDSLARVLARCGHTVHREFYVNDRGAQVVRYGASLAAAKAGLPTPVDGYAGEYIRDWAVDLPDGADPVEWGLERAHVDQHDVLVRMGVHFDTWSSEREVATPGNLAATLAELKAKGAVYDEYGAVWLRTSSHGDDKDRVLIRSDGEPTYFLPDIAFHRDKFARGWDHLINVLGADHHGYVQRMAAAVELLGHRRDSFEAIIGQNVVLMRAGEEVKLSKRRGDIIELAEVLDEVGPDATRFTYLLQSIDTRQVFDLDVVVQQSMDNPVFYVQMANARLAGLARNAAARGVVRQPLADVDLSVLVHQRELDLLTSLGELPEVVLDAADRRAPNKLTTWTRQMAGAVHGFHHDCWVVADDVAPELTQARLWLVEASHIGLAVALDLLGVTAPDTL